MEHLKHFSLTEPKRKRSRFIKIAHLSDLHFKITANIDKDPHILRLRKDIKHQDPDIIVVTGDLIENEISDGFFSSQLIMVLKNVKNFLIKLCDDSKIKPKYGLCVVPGNHDFRMRGIKHREYCKKNFNDLMGRFMKNQPIPSLNLLICSFDSNCVEDYKVNFASGLIEESDIITYFDKLKDNWSYAQKENSKLEYNFDGLIKIALLHHHPMPIADAEMLDLKRREEFLLLKNAGAFMKAMASNNMDIVLHGHKHFPGYSRTGFILEDDVYYTSIVAAGSAGKADPFYSYNIITIDNEGEIEVEHRISIKGEYAKLRKKFPLLSYEEFRINRRKRFIRSYEGGIEFSVDSLRQYVEIKGDGSAFLEINFEKLKSFDGEPKISMPYSAILPPYSQPNDPKFSSRTTGQSAYLNNGDIIFKPPVGKKPIHFRINVPVANSFYFNKRNLESVREHPPNITRDDEYIFFRMGYDVNDFSMQIVYPDLFRPLGKPHISVYNSFDENLIDEKEQSYCSNLINYLKKPGVVTFSNSNPIPGFSYEISWKLPIEDYEYSRLKYSSQAKVRSLREKLSKVNNPTFNQISKKMKELQYKIIKLESYDNLEQDNLFEIMLFGFDHNKRCLRLSGLAECQKGCYNIDTNPIKNRKWIFGDGIIGQALRSKGLTTFHAESTGEPSLPSPKVLGVCDSTEEKEHKLTIAFPLHYPPVHNGAIIGILSLATCSNESGLYSLMDPEKEFAEAHRLVHDHFYEKVNPYI